MTAQPSTGTPELSFSRRTWMTLEPIHALVYFSPLATDIYAAAGLVGREGYFGSRAAPLGAASAELVRSTFFNFAPSAVSAAIPSAWAKASPEEITTVRYEVVRQTLAKLTPDHLHTDDTKTAAVLAKKAALHAVTKLDGRPLFAAHAALAWPSDDEPALVLWHAQTLLREFRGDGHIAALVAEGLSGIDAHVTHIATGQMPVDIMRSTRAWPEDNYQEAVTDLTQRGLISVAADGVLALTAAGAQQRARIEALTDKLAEAPYLHLGEAACTELRRAGRPLSKAVVDAGLSPLRRLPDGED
jgi:hypothetical protein